jgi:hypothetical protein
MTNSPVASHEVGGILSIKNGVFFEKEDFLKKTVFFFYTRISVKYAVYLNIKKS